MPNNWRDIITETHVPVIVSPLHDKDLNLDGSEKKPHYHILVMYSGPKTLLQFSETFLEPLNTEIYQVADDVGGCARYCCHLNETDKVKYSVKDIQCFNGANFEEVAFTVSEEYELIKTIMDFARENRIYYYWDLCDYALTVDRSWCKIILNRTVFWVAALKSLKTKHQLNNVSVVDCIIYGKEIDNDN